MSLFWIVLVLVLPLEQFLSSLSMVITTIIAIFFMLLNFFMDWYIHSNNICSHFMFDEHKNGGKDRMVFYKSRGANCPFCLWSLPLKDKYPWILKTWFKNCWLFVLKEQIYFLTDYPIKQKRMQGLRTMMQTQFILVHS